MCNRESLVTLDVKRFGGLRMVVTQLPAQRAALEAGRRDWWRSAACREADPELFFPVTAHGPGADDVARAKEVCVGCRVRRECLQ